ncbi:hypothetical protein [Aurantibacter sp.]|uniref:hypothetical protein n=1 Tax=Aurantibacter sp. TaxID=2807103 RepID=UPI0035C7DB0B
MEKILQVKSEYNSLDSLNSFLNSASDFQCSKEYDIWDHRVDARGQMEECLVLKKSGMHAAKVFFTKENEIKVNYVIPNKIMNTYFGKSVKARRSIVDIVAETITQAVLSTPQKNAFNELTQVVEKAAL